MVGRVGRPSWNRSWGAFAVVLPCWDGRRAVFQQCCCVTFWDTGGFCWDTELLAPAVVMFCCPQLFEEDSASRAGLPRAVPLEPPCPCCSVQGLEGAVDTRMLLCPVCSPIGAVLNCCLLSPGGPWNFAFTVKFYPPDPAQLTEDITR